tara:strand:+ start:323 stop:1039 length:717 start_codon:yes stop_codon:yes gene_type:complete
MHKIIVVTGRPFAGKRIFAEYIDNNSDGRFSYIPSTSEVGGNILFSYFSQKEGKKVSVSITDLLDVIEDGSIPVLVCDNNSVRDILCTAEDYQLEVYSVYLDVDLEVSLTRFLETLPSGEISNNFAEDVSETLTKLINIEKNIQHHVSYDIAIDNKKLRKSAINKINKLINNDKKEPRAEVVKRTVDEKMTTHTLGMKTFIYNQLKAYKSLNENSKKALVKGVSLIVDCYRSKVEEDL